MKIYDISQPIPACRVYPGDRIPELVPVCRMEMGDTYNLTDLSMCVHNGTHVDAPFHFFKEGIGAAEIPLSHTVGWCYVADLNRELTALDARDILIAAKQRGNGAEERILIKGEIPLSEAAAEVFAEAGVLLVGAELQSVGDPAHPMAVHKILLSHGAVLLEGIVLKDIPGGTYFLSAAPLALTGADGAPCRAMLMKF